MNFYNPNSGEVDTGPVAYRANTCFLLTQIGGAPTNEVEQIQQAILSALKSRNIKLTDATSEVTGKDFLLKIWKMIYSVPLVVAVVQRDMPALTRLNIFYELGVAQAMGKETVVVVGKDTEVPSDLVRTEYIAFDREFKAKFRKFLKGYLDLSGYYESIADQLDRNPVLAIDYLRRAYLISGERGINQKAQHIVKEENFAGRARNSVELLLAGF
jgi:hypothetical protein